MRRAFTFALCVLTLAGCATHRGRTPATAAGHADAPAPSPMQVVGHVIAVDPRTLDVIVDVAPYAVLPTDFERRILLTRTEDLQPTARLQASPYLRGHTLGTRLLIGRPNVGDEVVLPPAAQ
jgi:hypothetical protein